MNYTALILTFIASLAAGALAFPIPDGLTKVVLGLVGVACGLAATVMQFRQGQPYVQEIQTGDWQLSAPDRQQDSEFELVIPATRHKRGKKPLVHLETPNGAEVWSDIERQPNGDVRLGAGIRVELRAILR